MSFTLKMSGVIVGRSDLETRDEANGVARGSFRPGLGYDLVEPIFALYRGPSDRDALTKYRTARDALKLQLLTPAGSPVSVRELHIVRRWDAASGRDLVLEVESDDPTIWNA